MLPGYAEVTSTALPGYIESESLHREKAGVLHDDRPPARSPRRSRRLIAAALFAIGLVSLVTLSLSFQVFQIDAIRSAKIEPMPRTKTLWQSLPAAEGVSQMSLAFTSQEMAVFNVTSVEAAVRFAVVDPTDEPSFSSYATPGHALLHIRYYSWDLPFNKIFGWLTVASALSHIPDLSYYVVLRRPSISAAPYRSAPCELRDDLYCQVPHHLISMQDDTQIAIALHVEYQGRQIGLFNLVLEQRTLPISPLAICNKPLFGSPNFPEMLQWREHHRMLGFEVVHWSSRNPEHVQWVDQLNNVTGGHDTFDWIPTYQNIGTGDEPESAAAAQYLGSTKTVIALFDEVLNNDDCYVKYRYLSDFMAVIDHDEYLSMGMEEPWTRAALEDWCRRMLPTNIASVFVRYTWIDRGRFPAVPKERLSTIRPSLTEADLADLKTIEMAYDGYKVADRPHEFVQHYKSIHSTRKVRHASIHSPKEWLEGSDIMRDDLSLTVFHARWHQEDKEPKEAYSSFPLTSSIVEHWLNLSRRLRAIQQGNEYFRKMVNVV